MSEEAGALAGDPDDTETGQRIIDANNLLGVNFLHEGAGKSKSVGRIVLPVDGGNRLGTGFLVSGRVLMTNNHVLATAAEVGGALVEFDFHLEPEGSSPRVQRFRTRPGDFFMTDEALDYTLVAVEPTNDAGDVLTDRGFIPLISSSGKAVVGERVSIIQHPGGERQQVALHDNRVVDIAGDFLHYETDTKGGSSGSPVFNIQWDLAALHHAAVGNKNEGTRISRIVEHLRSQFESDESTSVGVGVFRDLMAATAAPASDGEQPAAASPGSLVGPTATMNPDGTTSWVVPVSITVGVGQNPVVAPPGAAPAGDGQPTPATAPTPVVDSYDMQVALQKLEDGSRRVYYSATKDTLAREAYYEGIDMEAAPDDLYEALAELLGRTHTTTLSYKKARLHHLYPWIHRRDGPNRPLKGIYSNKAFDATEAIIQELRAEAERERMIHARSSLESLESVDDTFLEELEAAYPFNCEHVVPQSWFNKRKQPRTDLHHLFTCEWGCNSFRGNHAYYDFNTEAFRENCGEREDGKFEPKYGKGAVARATLYFLLRYLGDVASSNKEMPVDRLPTFIDWARDDLVDRWELHRNAEIEKVQGNRNPLIDFPELIDRINFRNGFRF